MSLETKNIPSVSEVNNSLLEELDTDIDTSVDDDIDDDDEAVEGEQATDSQEDSHEKKEEDNQDELYGGKYKSIEEWQKGLNERQSMLDRKEQEAIKALHSELENTKQVLKQVTGMQDLSQMHIYEEDIAIQNEYARKRESLICNYFNMPQNEIEYKEAMDLITNNFESSLACLDSKAASRLTLELMSLAEQEKEAQKSVMEKTNEWRRQSNESIKQSVADLIAENKNCPEDIARDINEFISNTIDRFSSQNRQPDKDKFIEDITKVINISEKAYQLGMKEGIKQEQLATDDNKKTKKLTGISNTSSINNGMGDISDIEAYNRLSPEEKAKFIAN